MRFVHEVLRRLRPGVAVMALHGAMNQLKRVEVYESFCRKEYAVLLATDIAARGLGMSQCSTPLNHLEGLLWMSLMKIVIRSLK